MSVKFSLPQALTSRLTNVRAPFGAERGDSPSVEAPRAQAFESAPRPVIAGLNSHNGAAQPSDAQLLQRLLRAGAYVGIATTVGTYAMFGAGLSAVQAGGDISCPPALNGIVQPGVAQRALCVVDINDLVASWSPGQHLYVMGDVGVPAERLDALQQWLNENGSNWTVVLVQSSEGQRFVAPEGTEYTNWAAVEFGLGLGLVNATSFTDLTDPVTGQPNGAILVIGLSNELPDGGRPLFYVGSAAQDSRGLGEANWVGNLSGLALGPLRDGGNLVGAVQATVSGINGRVNAAIQAEQASVAQQVTAAQTAISVATGQVGLLEARAAGFLDANPGAAGSLANPDTAGMRADLAAAQALLDAGDPAGAQAAATNVNTAAAAAIAALDGAANAPTTIAALRAAVDVERGLPFANGAALDEAQAALDAAARDLGAGQSSYAGHLNTAESALARAQAARQAEEAARSRAELLRTVAALALAIGTSGGAFALAMRRAGVKGEAEKVLAEWDTAMRAKLEALNELMKQMTYLGIEPTKEATAEMFEGRTLELAMQIVHDTDEVLMMHAAALKLKRGAEELIHPSGVLAKVRNLFTKGHYDAALALLSDHPIVVEPGDSLDLVLNDHDDRDLYAKLYGRREDYQPFTVTFEQLIEAYNERAERAVTNFTEIRSARDTVKDTVAATQRVVAEARALEAPLTEGDVQVFQGSNIFATLLPAVEAALALAEQHELSDPVTARRAGTDVAVQRAEDALALAKASELFRQNGIPQAEQAMTALEQAGIGAQWVLEDVTTLSQEADALAVKAVESSQVEDIRGLHAELEGILQDAQDALEGARRLTGSATDNTAAARDLVEKERAKVAQVTGAKPQAVFLEASNNPETLLAEAEKLLTEAKAALGRGEVSTADGQLDRVDAIATEVATIVELTVAALKAYPAERDARLGENDALSKARPDHQRYLDEMQKQFAPSVLSLGAGDPTHPNANGTVLDNLHEVDSQLEQARLKIARADEAFKAGRPIEASDLLRQAQAHQEGAAVRLQEIREKRERLAKAVELNFAQYAELEQRAQNTYRSLENPSVRQATLDVYNRFVADFQAANDQISAKRGDPFIAEAKLREATQALDSVDAAVKADQVLHRQAKQDLSAAVEALNVAGQLSRQADTDGVTDSTATDQAQQALQRLNGALGPLQQALKQPHQDWADLSARLTKLTTDAAQVGGVLRGELDAVQRSATAINEAATAIRHATTWSGSHGVSISGSPGRSVLRNAEQALSQGNYAEALRLAEEAERDAKSAVRDAESEVQQAIREEERERQEAIREAARQEKERKEREEERTSVSGGSTTSHTRTSGGATDSW